MDDLLSKLQTAKTLVTFATIGPPIAIVLIVVGVITSLILFSTPGISGEQTATTALTSPSPSFAPAPKASINFYCQYDSKWTSAQCDIIHFGCDPTSIAIILGSFGDKEWTPSEVALRNGKMGCSGATSKNETIDALRWTRTLGYKVAGLEQDDDSGYLVSDDGNFNFLRAKKYLDAGYLIHAGAVVTFKSNGIKRGGHSFVITDVNPASKEITAYDPTYCFTDSDSGIRVIGPDDIGGDGTGNTWYWAFPIKKATLAR